MTVEVKLSDGGSKSAWCLEALTRGRVCLEGVGTCSDSRRWVASETGPVRVCRSLSWKFPSED